MNTLNELLEKEQEMQRMLESLKKGLADAVQNENSVFVPFKNASVRCGIVRLSDIMANNKIMSAEVYIPACQADAVMQKLDSCTTLAQLASRVREMIQTRVARFSQTRAIVLNKETLRILRESEIGQFAMAQD